MLLAYLVNRPGAREAEGEPAIAVQDLTAMFVDKRQPEGWNTWKKTQIDWVRNTIGLLISAGKEYWRLKRCQMIPDLISSRKDSQNFRQVNGFGCVPYFSVWSS
jgi:hypothetical protein